MVIALVAWTTRAPPPSGLQMALWFLLALGFSRINEVVYAFWRDSMDRVLGTAGSSSLSTPDRIGMLVRSGAGLVVWFAVAYLVAARYDGFNRPIGHFGDALYFSALTLLGIGQEGQEAVSLFARVTHVWQALSGTVLLVVAISVYLGGSRER